MEDSLQRTHLIPSCIFPGSFLEIIQNLLYGLGPSLWALGLRFDEEESARNGL